MLSTRVVSNLVNFQGHGVDRDKVIVRVRHLSQLEVVLEVRRLVVDMMVCADTLNVVTIADRLDT